MRLRLPAFFSIIAALCFVHDRGHTAPPADSAPAITLKDVSYAELEQVIRSLHGKVVVVDIWSTTCPPCKRNYPHFLSMAKEFADQGLVCVSVSVDPKERAAKALEFLKEKGSTIANYRLDDDPPIWQDKWNVGAIPVNFVFDREGRRVKKFDNEDPDKTWGPPDVEKLVKELLAKKRG